MSSSQRQPDSSIQFIPFAATTTTAPSIAPSTGPPFAQNYLASPLYIDSSVYDQLSQHSDIPQASSISDWSFCFDTNTTYPLLEETGYSSGTSDISAQAQSLEYPAPHQSHLAAPASRPSRVGTGALTTGQRLRRHRRQQASRSDFTEPHVALREMMLAHHNSASSDDVPDFMSSKRSDSTHGNNTPITPVAAPLDDSDDKAYKMPANGGHRPLTRIPTSSYSPSAEMEFSRGLVGLYRTESAACQDELFNPANFDATPPSPPSPPKIRRPHHKTPSITSPQSNLVNAIVRTANQQRSHSPASAAKPDPGPDSPFRKGAIEAPAFKQADPVYSPATSQLMPTAAAARQRDRESAAKKEFDAFRPTLQREVTKTISPKDALLDAPDLSRENSISAFTDIIPDGYERSVGGSQAFASNFVSGTQQAFGQFMPMNQAGTNMGGFRGLDINNWLSTPLQPPISNVAAATAIAPPPTSTQSSDKNPVFPAQLTSMESSASENLPMSSQESALSATIRRPENTSANGGTYSCASPGCIQRFDSPAKLQKHKRDAHTPASSQAKPSATPEQSDAASGDNDSAGSSPEPVGSGMTSSALLARNSQSGPHKCNRINPTTGKPCNAIFSRPYDLTRHEDTIHNNKKMKVRCEFCREEKTFSRNDALTRHMRVVHPEVDFQGKRGRRVL